MKYVYVAVCSDYIEVFATLKLAIKTMKEKGLVKRHGAWCEKHDGVYELTEFDIFITKHMVMKE